MKITVIEFFTKHPTGANLLMLVLVLIGVVALPNLKRETFPSFTTGKVQVRVVYPGASVNEVEETICQRIQDAIDGISNVNEVTCEALDGVGIAVAEWDENGEFDRFVSDIKTEVEAINTFPDEAEDPVVKELNRTDHVMSIALTGPMSVTALKAYAEEMKDRLQLIPEISLVEIQGFSEHQIRIELRAQTLRQYGLNVAGIANTIQRQNTNLPAGSVETRNQDILIRFMDQRYTPEEFAGLIVLGNQSGAEIRLGDIAKITDRFEKDEEKILFNGERAAILKISKNKSQDAILTGNAIQRFVEKEQQILPKGVKMTLTENGVTIVKDRLNLLVTNGWQGLILVILVLWLFFNIRFAFWVGMGLPVTFLGTLFFMNLLGQSLNMITMVGLLIAIGLLMDDAIVIAENIASKMKKGQSAMEAAYTGLQGVGVGVFSSFLTTICMFGPLMFLEGNIGKVLQVLPVVLIVTLTVSLVEAFFILPRHIGHSLHGTENLPQNRFRKNFENKIEWLRQQVLGKMVDWVVDWRYLFMGGLIGLFIISIGMLASGNLKFVPFPDTDGDNIDVQILLPQGAPLEQTEVVVGRVLAALEEVNQTYASQQSENQNLIKNVSVQYNTNAGAHESGSHVATIKVDLLSAEIRQGRVDDILELWREKTGSLPGVIHIHFKEPAVGPAGKAIDIRLQGSNLEVLKAASLEMQSWLNSYRGVINLSDDLRPGKLEYRLSLRDGALALGLDANEIARQLRSAYFGSSAGEILVGAEAYEVNVRLEADDRNSLADLEYFTIMTDKGIQVPLSSVAQVTLEKGYARVYRVDGLRTVTIQGDTLADQINSGELLNDVSQNFLPDFQKRYPNVQVVFGGEKEEGGKTQASILQGFMLGLFGVFMLLSFQFRSYLEPIIIILVIPFSLIGVIWGHWLMGLDITMPSMIGFVSLSGIIVNDSILLVEFMKIRINQGRNLQESSRHASRDRFRAILLTSLTTIAGMTPLLFETSLQAQVLIPLVVSLVFGMITATFIVLLMVPAFYNILDDFNLIGFSKKE